MYSFYMTNNALDIDLGSSKHTIPDEIAELLSTYFPASIAPNNPVKIAVLDSGFKDRDDMHLLALRSRERVFRRVSFITPSSGADVVGHGTHVCRVLLEYTADSVILSGKISNTSDFEKKPAECPTQKRVMIPALQWATREADIIVLPWGLVSSPCPDIQSELKTVASNKIVLVAAGNTNGERPTWPACTPDVFPVYSMDENRKPDAFNARMCDGNLNIGAHGSGIICFWRQKATTESGTSLAVGTAAALVANILEFARRELPDVPKALDSPAVMKRLIQDHLLVPGKSNDALPCFSLATEGFWDGRKTEEVAENLRRFILRCAS